MDTLTTTLPSHSLADLQARTIALFRDHLAGRAVMPTAALRALIPAEVAEAAARGCGNQGKPEDQRSFGRHYLGHNALQCLVEAGDCQLEHQGRPEETVRWRCPVPEPGRPVGPGLGARPETGRLVARRRGRQP